MTPSVYSKFGDARESVYVDPAVVVFTASPGIAEIGSTVEGVALNWQLSKMPLGLILDGDSVPVNVDHFFDTGTYTTNQTWVLKMSDSEKSVSGKANLWFQNKRYWGNVASVPADSADILALASLGGADFIWKYGETLQFGSPNGNFPCYAYPSRLGSPRKITIGVPTDLWTPVIEYSTFTDYTVTVVSFTNPSGYTENYNVVTFNTARDDSSLSVQFS